MNVTKTISMRTRVVKWLFLLLIGLSSCYDFPNIDSVEVDPFTPNLVFNLMNSKITFAELANKTGANSIIEEYPGSDLYFVSFRDTIDVGLASNLFPAIPPIVFNDSYQLSVPEVPGAFPAGTTLGPITKSYDQTYNTFPGAELKRVDLSGGTLEFTLTSTFDHTISGNITIVSLKDNSNNPISIPFTLTNLGTQNFVENLNGRYLDLYPAGVYNTINYSVTATITSSGAPISSANSIDIQLSLNSPAYEKITGKLTYTYNLSDQSYNIGMFESTVLAEQHFADPKFSLSFINSFGLPSSASFATFEVENKNGDKVSVVHEGPVNADDLLIGSPNLLKFATSSKTSDTTKLKLTATNSNVEDLFDIAPKTMSFAGAVFDIGDAADPSHDYFVKNDSKFQLLSDIEIPLSGWVVTNEIADTLLNVDWPDLEDDYKLTDAQVRLKIKFINGMPINLFLQVKFLDTNGAVVTELFDGGETKLIQSSEVNPATGETINDKVAYSYITIDKAKYDQMRLSQDMVIILRFTTGGNLHQNIKILSTNSLAIQMLVEASGTVKL
ncbi:MAG TPA: hypothetical protein DIW31_06540 [Bacteroidales bacterium]|nr:hypothetical protein [Bacteroidales bacterium]